MHLVTRLAWTLNGITIAYLMGLVNAMMAMLLAFGLKMTPEEQASIVAFFNAALVAVAHLTHRLGETTSTLHSEADRPTAATARPNGHEERAG